MLKGLGGLGNLGNLTNAIKQAMNVKERIEELKARMADERIEGAAGGGMVKVVMSGRTEVLEIKIDPEVIDRNEPEVLETLVRAAVNDAVNKTQELIKAKMKEIAGGVDLDIPGIS